MAQIAGAAKAAARAFSLASGAANADVVLFRLERSRTKQLKYNIREGCNVATFNFYKLYFISDFFNRAPLSDSRISSIHYGDYWHDGGRKDLSGSPDGAAYTMWQGHVLKI